MVLNCLAGQGNKNLNTVVPPTLTIQKAVRVMLNQEEIYNVPKLGTTFTVILKEIDFFHVFHLIQLHYTEANPPLLVLVY